MKSSASPVPQQYDVIIVGGGNAALCAALSAVEEGARVVLLEAAPREERGGNSRFPGSVFRAPHRGLEQVQEVLCEEALEDVRRCSMSPYTPDDFLDDQPPVVGMTPYSPSFWFRKLGRRSNG